MTRALFRLTLPGRETRLARGSVEAGAQELLPLGRTIGDLLGAGGSGLANALAGPGAGPVPAGSSVMAPVDDQEVWAAGVTYERSRAARVEESVEPSVYDRVYGADRPELFFKAPGWRVRGPGAPIGVRADSIWDVPEPELGLVIAADLTVAGYTVGNDVSSRTIEGDNPLYLPQAKIYEGACALGPAIVPSGDVQPPFLIRLTIVRDGQTIVDEAISTARLRRPLGELVEHLGRALDFPHGAVLLTGTGIVPEQPFTLLPGDTVRIDCGPLGVLENPVERVGRPPPA